MYIGAARVSFRLFQSSSLKDKRQVVRSVLARLRNQFDVSTAEVDEQETWNLAVIGIAYVSSASAHAAQVVERAAHAIETIRPDVEVTESTIDVFSME